MESAPHICAVTVNHNTSQFVELMLRTLFLTNDLSGLRLAATVLDNRSDDAPGAELRAYLAERGIPLVQTGFDAAVAPEKHGAALADFVGARQECSHFLFLDADIWFIEPDTVPAMLRELADAPAGTFAVQARIQGYYAGRTIEGRDGVPGASDAAEYAAPAATFDGRIYAQTVAPRCSPVCCLVANTPVFRRVVAGVGLSPACRFGVGRLRFYDTFGLMTEVMATHGQGFAVSSKSVNHFTQAASMPELRPPKERDCQLLLDDLRAGRGMGRENFYTSDWVRSRQ
jgi:hypothetical protein